MFPISEKLIAFGKWKGKKGKNEIKSLLTISIIHFF